MISAANEPLAIVKVGGSLFDLPDLGPKLRVFLQHYSNTRLLLVPGGGPLADAVRELDRTHRLGEEASHWLALQALTVNAHFLARLLDWPVVEDPVGPAVLDMHAFARSDDERPGALPHSWDVTSDSLALGAALFFGARALVLLKSVSLPAGMTWEQASDMGIVDRYFPQGFGEAPAELEVRVVNFR